MEIRETFYLTIDIKMGQASFKVLMTEVRKVVNRLPGLKFVSLASETDYEGEGD